MELIIFWFVMNWWYFARQLADGSVAVTFFLMTVQNQTHRAERRAEHCYPRRMKNL